MMEQKTEHTLSRAISKTRADRLAHEIARTCVESLLRSTCVTEDFEGETWLDLNTDGDHAGIGSRFAVDFEDEIQYAESQGFLRHHSECLNLVQLVEDRRLKTES